MYEIEAKAPLTKADFKRLRKQLKTADFKGKFLKKDIYYDDTKKVYIRVRESNKKTLFEIKEKKIINGVESNIEIGWGIKDGKKWATLLGKLGIKPTILKNKKTEAYKLNGFNIELNYVSGLGYFLEIEKIVKTKPSLPAGLSAEMDRQVTKAKKELIDIFGKFGYSQKDFEKKYYLDLLQEKRKNV